MDRPVISIILIASLLATGSGFASASAAFWERACAAGVDAVINGIAFEIAAGVAEAAAEAVKGGTAVKLKVILPEEALVVSSGTSLTVFATFNGRLLNASVALVGEIELQPSRVRSSFFTITAFPNGTAKVTAQETAEDLSNPKVWG